MIGQLVGKYRIAEKIGEGGMGAVYRAEHVVLGSPAAIKVLLPQWTRNRQVVDRFLTEARAASAIRHVGIVQVFDAGRLDNGQAYIAMELLAGSSLADLLERRGTLTPPLALAVGGQILAALDAAHVVGVIHRDLKPDNIQLVRDPTAPSFIRVKLLDFGIAKLLFDAEGRRLPTAGGALLGTPSYMSPEQCAGHSVDARSDLYSVGCILFEMLTGQPPFYGDTSADIVAMHLHEPPPLLRSVDPTLSRELEQLVSRMLDKDPEERTPSAAWALAALERAVFDAPANAPTAVAAPLVLAAMSAGPPALPGGPVPLPPPASGQYGAAMPARPPGLGQYSAMSAPPASGQYGAAMPARPPASGQYGAAMSAPPASGQYGAAMPARPPGLGQQYGAMSAPPASGQYGAAGSSARLAAHGAAGSSALCAIRNTATMAITTATAITTYGSQRRGTGGAGGSSTAHSARGSGPNMRTGGCISSSSASCCIIMGVGGRCGGGRTSDSSSAGCSDVSSTGAKMAVSLPVSM